MTPRIQRPGVALQFLVASGKATLQTQGQILQASMHRNVFTLLNIRCCCGALQTHVDYCSQLKPSFVKHRHVTGHPCSAHIM
jgi:hypothetical protein